MWFSKRHNWIEAYTFGSDFTVINNSVEIVEDLIYNFLMFGVSIDGPTKKICDNWSIYSNMIRTESTLTNKHHSIAYHHTQEEVPAGTIRVSKYHISTNLDYVLTKTMVSPRREEFLYCLTYYEGKVESLVFLAW